MSKKKYLVQNRITKECQEVWADSAQEACQSVGWQIGDCHVMVGLKIKRGK